MNKRNIDFTRFNTAYGSARPCGSSISDKQLAHQVREYYDILEVVSSSESQIATHSPETETTYEYLYAKDVAKLLNVGTSKAYELIAEANEKLKAKGKYVIPGRVPRKLFMEQLY
jgi:hypothetical protein